MKSGVASFLFLVCLLDGHIFSRGNQAFRNIAKELREGRTVLRLLFPTALHYVIPMIMLNCTYKIEDINYL